MKTTTPYRPWEIMSYAKDLLGIGYMQRLLGIKSQTQVYRYCRNPEMITEDPPATGFIERTRQLGVDLQQAGADDAARAIAEYIAEALGYEIVKKGEAIPDKPTLCEEKLDDFVAVCAYHEDMRLGRHPQVIQRAFAEALDELRQTKAKYLSEYYRKHGKDKERRVA